MPSIPSLSSLIPSSLTSAVDNGQAQARAQLTQVAQNNVQDPNAKELATKVDALVKRQFGGDYKKAFQSYAGPNGEVSPDGVSRLLSDAGVGNLLTRGMWTSGVMDKFDTNHNGSVSWQEFSGALRQNGVNVGS